MAGKQRKYYARGETNQDPKNTYSFFLYLLLILGPGLYQSIPTLTIEA